MQAAPKIRRSLPFAAVLGTFFAASAAPTPLYRIYQEEFGLLPVTATLVFAVYALALLKTLLFAGSVSDHLGRKRVVLAALVLEMAAMLLFAFADGAAMLIAARIVQGIATAIAAASLGAALVDADPGRGPLVNAVSPPVGMAVGALGTGALVQFGPQPLHGVYWLLLALFAAETVALLTLRDASQRKPGALASLRPRLALPAQARRAFLTVTPLNLTTWMLTGFYLSLVPGTVAATTGLRAPLLGGAIVAVLMAVGALAVLARRNRPPLANLRLGAGFVIAGVLVVVAGVNLASVGVLVAGTVLSGIGFGTGFLGSTRYLLPLAAPDERAGLLSAFYIESYLAFSLPAILAGWLVLQVGYALTADLFGAAILLLGGCGLLALARQAPAARAVPA